MSKETEKQAKAEVETEELDNTLVPVPTDNAEKGYAIVSTKNGAVIVPFRRKRGEGETQDELHKRAEIAFSDPKFDIGRKQGLFELRETEKSTTFGKPKPYANILLDGQTIMVLDKSKSDSYVDTLCSNAQSICKGGFDGEIYTGDKKLYARITYNPETDTTRLEKLTDKRK